MELSSKQTEALAVMSKISQVCKYPHAFTALICMHVGTVLSTLGDCVCVRVRAYVCVCIRPNLNVCINFVCHLNC